MEKQFDQIIQNAQAETGPYAGCPVHEDTVGALVNPGLLNPAGDIMCLTMDPSHYTDWDEYEDWEEYNETKSPMFTQRSLGGKKLSQLLEPLGYSLDDVWLGDELSRTNPTDAQAALRHSSIAITNQSYSHIEAGEISDVIECTRNGEEER
ncbi:hypothetical protein [Haladaptatus sp. NG-SE-30]